MSYFDDNEHRIVYGRQPLRLAKQDLTCRKCGATCYWQEVIDGEGLPKAKLFKGGKPHVCDVTDDFDDLTEEKTK